MDASNRCFLSILLMITVFYSSDAVDITSIGIGKNATVMLDYDQVTMSVIINETDQYPPMSEITLKLNEFSLNMTARKVPYAENKYQIVFSMDDWPKDIRGLNYIGVSNSTVDFYTTRHQTHRVANNESVSLTKRGTKYFLKIGLESSQKLGEDAFKLMMIGKKVG